MDSRVMEEALAVETLTDEILVGIAKDGDRDTLEYIIKQYSGFVISRARAYFLIGAEWEDVVQEGMIGLYKAILDYKPEKMVPFKAFADLCIKRNILTAIKSASSKKHMILNAAISLDKPLFNDESNKTLLDMVDIGCRWEPEKILMTQEMLKDIMTLILSKLSDLELNILILYLDGLTYEDIAFKLYKSKKAVDNAIQRIRKKLNTLLSDSELVS